MQTEQADIHMGQPRKTTGPRRVGSFIGNVARKAFEEHGFPSAAILTDWQAIAGADLASFTQPERLTWPRGADDAREGAANGGTLILRVDGPRALEVQHVTPQLLERVNRYFGYGAVARLRIVQAPVRRRTPDPGPPPEPAEAPLTDAIGAIGDRGLQRAVGRLGARLASRNR